MVDKLKKKKIKIGTEGAETYFIIDEKYTIVDKLGKGAYGQVVKAEDQTEKDEENKPIYYAIKKIEDIFEHVLYAKRTLRELKILRLLDHDNVNF